MTAKRNRGAESLPFEVKREPVGTVERAAGKDLAELKALGMMTTATSALAASYRRAARDVDRSDKNRDPWAAASAMRELRALRLELAPTASPLAGDSLGDLLSNIADVVRQQRETSTD